MNILLQNVWYKYLPNKIALRNITLNIKEKITIIVGPNASGKTTLLKIISLIYRPWKGKVIIDSKDYWSLPKNKQLILRRKITYVPEKPVFIRGTVLDNILLGVKIRGLDTNGIDLVEKASELSGIFGLEDKLYVRPKALSAGQRQLISIIRALILEPEVLVLDEPTANLDNENRKILFNYLEKHIIGDKLKKVIIATHDLIIPLLLKNSYVIVLDSGELIKQGYAREVLDYEYKKLYNILRKKNN